MTVAKAVYKGLKKLWQISAGVLSFCYQVIFPRKTKDLILFFISPVSSSLFNKNKVQGVSYHFYLCFQSKTVDTQWACVICSSITYSVLQGNPLCRLHSSWEGFGLCADTQAGVQTHSLILANKLSQRFSILLRKSIAPYQGPQSQPWLPSPLSGLCSGHCVSRSVVSDSVWPRGLQPARLLSPWDSPGKNTGVGCHSLLQGIFPT